MRIVNPGQFKIISLVLQIVFNQCTYPNFLRFLDLVQIPYIPTEMTFSVSRAQGEFEWAGRNLFTFFCQPRNLMKPSMWVMLYDILRFNACARRLLKEHSPDKIEYLTIGVYLKQQGYSNAFINNYLIVSCLQTHCNVCLLRG